MNTDFLKKQKFISKGIYDNTKVFENTKESFKSAIKNNLGIIFDVIYTKDLVPIIFNDTDLSRLLNLKDKIEDTTYEELLFLAPYHVLTFKEGLDIIKGKTPIIINITDRFLCKEVAKTLETYSSEFAIVSNDLSVIRWFNANNSLYIMGEIISKSRKHNLATFFANYSIKTSFKCFDIDCYDSMKIKKLRENSMVICYLITSSDELQIYKDEFDNFIIDKLI